MVKYDDASWHYGGDYPEGLAPEAAMTHIGMFLGWIVDNGLEGEYLKEECAEELARFRGREMTGAELLGRCCDGKLTSEELNAEANGFAEWYYEREYLGDYAETCSDDDDLSIYEEPDSWERFAAVSGVIGERYESWKAKKARKGCFGRLFGRG